jgi:hypothetical protein
MVFNPAPSRKKGAPLEREFCGFQMPAPVLRVGANRAGLPALDDHGWAATKNLGQDGKFLFRLIHVVE